MTGAVLGTAALHLLTMQQTHIFRELRPVLLLVLPVI